MRLIIYYNQATIKFASSFCSCVIIVVTHLTSLYFIKVLFLMFMQAVGKALILYKRIVNLSF